MTVAALTAPYLDISAQEDVMELSTDFDRHHGTDGDTDIDIDLVPDQPQDLDTDYMIEDTRSEGETGVPPLPNETGNDDVMLDEEGSQGDLNDAGFLQDEDLDDAASYLQDDANQDFLAVQGDTAEYHDVTLQTIHRTTSHADPVFSTLPDTSEDKTREYPDNEVLDIREEDVFDSLDTEDNADTLKQHLHNPNGDEPAGPILEDPRDVLDWSDIPTSIGNTETDQKAANGVLEGEPQPEEVSSKLGSADPSLIEPQHEQVHEAANVHPVIVVYQDSEISLFPPSDQSNSPTFFLHDESLAISSICDLLLACKGVLADSISEEDELELNIEELGLCISEECLSAPNTTLCQILSLYLQLLHQDGTSDAGPLYMTLRTRTSFSKRLRGLTDAAKDGKGLSQLPYWDVPSDDDTATAADGDGDISYGNAEDPSEGLEAPDGETDKLSSDPVDNPLTQGQLGVSKNDATVSQDGSVVLEPSYDHDRSQAPEIEISAVTSEDHKAPTSDGILETTLSGKLGSKTDENDRIPSSEEAPKTRRSQDRDNSTQFLRADGEEDGDLIDYDEGEDPTIQNSTGSSTLAGDEAAGTANGMSASSFDQCYQPNICYCALCNNPSTTEDGPNSQQPHENNPITADPISNTSNHVTVEAEESKPLAREAVQVNEDLNNHTNQIQEDYQENGDDEDFDFGDDDDETIHPGTDDATAKPSKPFSQSYQTHDSNEYVALGTSADDGEYSHETTGVLNPSHPQDLTANGDAQQQSSDLNGLIDKSKPEADTEGLTPIQSEDTIDNYDQIADILETNQADSSASRHDLSGNEVAITASSEDHTPYAVVSAVDDDEITYDEDEIVDSPSQRTQEDHSNLETPSPLKTASIKRQRGENAEPDVPDVGSQDKKRIRSS